MGMCSFLVRGMSQLLGLDGDLARLRRFVLGQVQRQHAVLELRLDLVGVDRERQRQRADEAAVAAFLAVPDALFRDGQLAPRP